MSWTWRASFTGKKKIHANLISPPPPKNCISWSANGARWGLRMSKVRNNTCCPLSMFVLINVLTNINRIHKAWEGVRWLVWFLNWVHLKSELAQRWAQIATVGVGRIVGLKPLPDSKSFFPLPTSFTIFNLQAAFPFVILFLLIPSVLFSFLPIALTFVLFRDTCPYISFHNVDISLPWFNNMFTCYFQEHLRFHGIKCHSASLCSLHKVSVAKPVTHVTPSFKCCCLYKVCKVYSSLISCNTLTNKTCNMFAWALYLGSQSIGP